MWYFQPITFHKIKKKSFITEAMLIFTQALLLFFTFLKSKLINKDAGTD